MSSDRWQLVDDLFHQVIAQTGEARRAFLAQACAGNEELLREVERLVKAHEAASGFMSAPVAGQAFNLLSEPEPSPAGAMVGPYQIVRELGRGGMGAVYLAERADDQFHKRVAVKLIKRGLDTDAVLRRFRDEREILAGLEHPNIARLLDAGTADDGRPYVLMEYVDGLAIDRFCEQQRLTIDARLDLFLQVCAAVSYAHQRLIVHRDIKPSNILVTVDGSPKLLDFGIAKMMDAAGGGDTLATVMGGVRPMTPEYASPEYIQGLATTTLGDVYSLGVLLYELLTGRLPFRFESRTLEAIAHVVSTVDPPRPSDVTLDRRKRLQGDLDTIVLTALRRDRGQRYQSVDALADDLRRHLAGLPILARKAAPWYRAVKFVRRNRIAVGAAAAIAVSLVGGIAASTWEAGRARRAEQIAKAVNEFLQDDLLAQASAQTQTTPRTGPDLDIKVRTALDRAAARIQGKFDGQPEVEAAIRQTIGTTYSELGLYNEAQSQMERALSLRQRVLGAQHPDTLTSMQELGELYIASAKYAQAQALLDPLLESRRRTLGQYHQDTLRALNDLAGVVNAQADYRRAALLRGEVLDSDRRVLGREHPYTLIALNNLASTDSALGKYADAASLYQEAVEIMKRVMGAAHPATLGSMNGLAVVYRYQGKYAEAESLAMQVIDLRRTALGAEHHDTLLAIYSLAAIYLAQKRYTDAEPLLTDGLETSRRVLPDHPDTQNFVSGLAEVRWKRGDIAAAESLFQEAVAARRRILGANHPTIAHVLVSFGEMMLEQRRYTEAESLLHDAAGIYEKAASSDWRRDYAQALRGAALAALGRRNEGGPLVASAYEALVGKKDVIPAERQPVLPAVENLKSQLR